MKTLRQRADAHHDKGGHDESWLAGYRAAMRDAARSKRKPVPMQWVDAGYLGNNHCPYMLGSFNGPSCCRHYGHEGSHMTDSQSSGEVTK